MLKLRRFVVNPDLLISFLALILQFKEKQWMQSTDESPNYVTKKYRKLRKWLFNRSRKAETGAAEEDTNHKEKADQSSSPKSPPAKIQVRHECFIAFIFL